MPMKAQLKTWSLDHNNNTQDAENDNDENGNKVNEDTDCEDSDESSSACNYLKEFKKWLQSPNGGLKAQKCAMEHAFQAKVIATVAGGG